jgi:hypothetical protein
MTGFRIWYDNEKKFEGVGVEEWNALPKHGVLVVLDNKLWHMGNDYYWYEGGQVKSCRRTDIDMYLERDDGIRNVKFGRWADHHVWQSTLKDTENDGSRPPE